MEVIKDFNSFFLFHGAQDTHTSAADGLLIKRTRCLLDRVLQMSFISRLQQHYTHTPTCGNVVGGIFLQKRVQILQHIPVAGRQWSHSKKASGGLPHQKLKQRFRENCVQFSADKSCLISVGQSKTANISGPHKHNRL